MNFRIAKFLLKFESHELELATYDELSEILPYFWSFNAVFECFEKLYSIFTEKCWKWASVKKISVSKFI